MSLEGSLSGCRSSPLNEQSDGSDPRPSWTERLIDCTKVGDSYRGHVRREEDVEAVVLAHGSQTGTFWSTRQTPSSVANEQQQSTRLMWKSQHVPYDGMPFVNVGKRAVVMECCQGRHRRKQVQKEAASVRQRIDDGEDDGDDGDGRVPVAKRQRRMAGESARVFSVSCPAQICVKKVKKFTQFRVEEEGTARSGKAVRYAKEKCLKSLREVGIENLKGEIRWYMQLPTAQAHEFHVNIDALAAAGLEECIDHLYASQQMDPRLRRKVRELVKVGTTDLADVKDALYSYLENELFANEERPDPGDPCYYPADAELQMEIDLLKNESVNSLMISQRLNPSVLTRLRLLVLQGITNVLEVKHLLKNFVEKELFSKGDTIPDTHDRSFYPTITDLQNHVHVTKEAIANGNPVKNKHFQNGKPNPTALGDPPHSGWKKSARRPLHGSCGTRAAHARSRPRHWILVRYYSSARSLIFSKNCSVFNKSNRLD
eukprot:m.27810 g.27810  ORF g.27810 m.27810 type:complete len:486 (+) comp30374_c0_seq2:111-1568(+)